MLKRAFDAIGWLGTALVLAAVAVFFLKPEWQPYIALAGVGGAGLRPALHPRPVARDGAAVRRAIGAPRHDLGGLGHRGPRDPGRAQLHLVARAQALGPDRDEPVHLVAAVDQGAPEPGRPAETDGVRERDRVADLPRTARRIRVRLEEGLGRVRGSRQETGAGEAEADPGLRHGRHRIQGQDRAGRGQFRAGPDQRHHQGRHGQGAQGLLHAGPRREGHVRHRADGLQRHRRAAGARQLQGRAPAARPAGRRAGRRLRRRGCRPEGRFSAGRNRRVEGVPRQGRQADAAHGSPGEGR